MKEIENVTCDICDSMCSENVYILPFKVTEDKMKSLPVTLCRKCQIEISNKIKDMSTQDNLIRFTKE